MSGLFDRISVFLIGLQWNVRRVVRHFKRPGAFIVTVAIAVVTTTQILKNQDVPSHESWVGVTAWTVAYIGAAVIAAFGGILVTLGYATLVRRSTADSELADLCKSVWTIVQRHRTTIPFDKLGVHI